MIYKSNERGGTMNSPSDTTAQRMRHAGPPLGLVATIFVLLFLAGLYPVTMFGGRPYFPGPWEPAETIVAFFQARPTAVLVGAALHFGAAIPLGIFTATVVSRLHFLGVRAAGASIALFGGFATAFTMLASSSVLWTLAHPGIAQDRALTQALYWLVQALGGSGFSVPFGLLIAGIAIPAAFLKLLPKWIVVSGIALAMCGELSWLNLIVPRALFLVPLTRFPGFAWLIAAGFALPTTIERAAPATGDRVVRGKVA
jgi:hypothetical protein